MTGIEAVALVITSVVVPFFVQAIKGKALTGNAARWIAIGISMVAGLIAGFIGGIPTTPASWVTCIFASVGGVQVAYAAFKSVGITNKWLDALSTIGTPGKGK